MFFLQNVRYRESMFLVLWTYQLQDSILYIIWNGSQCSLGSGVVLKESSNIFSIFFDIFLSLFFFPFNINEIYQICIFNRNYSDLFVSYKQIYIVIGNCMDAITLKRIRVIDYLISLFFPVIGCNTLLYNMLVLQTSHTSKLNVCM